jgi:hypothetical protein
MLATFGICAAVTAQAQGPDQAAAMAAVRTLTVHPAIEPTPALKYRLLPTFYERKPGNAATLYKTAALLLVEHRDATLMDKIAKWNATPLAELPQEEVAAALAQFTDVLHYVELGAWRERCEWDWPLEDGGNMLLPDMQSYRNIARVLVLRARLQVLKRDYAGAMRTLETGFSFAAHVGHGPVLINDLVGIYITNLLLDATEDFVQAPDAPSLYWALSALPSPFVDIGPAMEFELGGMCWAPDELKHPEAACLSPAGWADIFGHQLAESGGSGGDGLARGVFGLSPLALALVTYTDAKQHLIGKGEAPDRVEAMPVFQVVAIYLRDGWRVSADEALKWWWYTPYPQARTDLGRIDRVFTEAGTKKYGWLVGLLMPALGRARFVAMMPDRRIAALRAVEAIRLHAAATGGSLPARLEDVRQAPIPLNPMTGEPFAYELQGNRAILSAPAERWDGPDTQVNYEIEIAK